VHGIEMAARGQVSADIVEKHRQTRGK
jgi:hypothetical protein